MSRYEVKFALMRVVARTSLLCSAGTGASSQEMPWGKMESLGLCRGDAASRLARRHQPEEPRPDRPAIRLSFCAAPFPHPKGFHGRTCSPGPRQGEKNTVRGLCVARGLAGRRPLFGSLGIVTCSSLQFSIAEQHSGNIPGAYFTSTKFTIFSSIALMKATVM